MRLINKITSKLIDNQFSIISEIYLTGQINKKMTHMIVEKLIIHRSYFILT